MNRGRCRYTNDHSRRYDFEAEPNLSGSIEDKPRPGNHGRTVGPGEPWGQL